jgi:glutathione S-transferase
MTLTLHAFPPSPRAFKTLVVAHHLGLDYKLRFLQPGETAKPEFSALNINQRMPVLEDGDYVLWESNAILEYLAARKPEANLMPQELKPRLQVAKWLYWESAHWDQAVAIFMFERFVKKVFNMGETSESEIARGTTLFTRLAKVLDTQLQNNRFIAGDHLTLADFAIAAPLPYRDKVSLPLENHGAIARWLGEIEALPAWSKTTAMQVLPAAA